MTKGILALAAVFAMSAGAACAAPPGSLPVRVFAEAEDFTVKDAGWQPVPYRENYFASTFAITFLSRMACLGAPEQMPDGRTAIAEQQVEIPYADEYQVLARYEQPFGFAAEFTVEIEQNGAIAFRGACGRLQDAKIWALNRHQRVPMERFWWGGTDNIVWQNPGAVRLAPGPARIRLLAGPQTDGATPRRNAARRNVDIVCLTNDKDGLAAQQKTNYLECDGWLVQDGDVFARITNPRDGMGPCTPVLTPVHHHAPHIYSTLVRDWPSEIRVLKSGYLPLPAAAYRNDGPRSRAVDPGRLARPLDPAAFGVTSATARAVIPESERLQPGDTSGWIPMGPILCALNDSHYMPAAAYASPTQKVIDLEYEFAIPDGRGGLKPIRKLRLKGPPAYYSTSTLLMPANIAARPVIQTQLETLQWLNAEVAKFPAKGPAAKRFPIYGILSFSGALDDKGPIGEESTKLALALGNNTIVGTEGSWARTLGVPERRTLMVYNWHYGALTNRIAEAQKENTARFIKIISLGDEINIAPLKPAKGEEAPFNRRFADWLKERRVEGPGPATYTEEPGNPWLYYSSLYSLEQGMQGFASAVRTAESILGPGLLCGANYSPHANYLVNELHWIRPFKAAALTLPWSEDYVWQVPEFSVQVTGYMVSGFRAGARYRNLPILMYIMPHSPGNTPRDFRLSFYTALAHGMKIAHYFCASPLSVGGSENYVDTHDLGMWREIHAVSHEAGTFEDYVLDGAVRPARVGLLLSSVDDVLSGEHNSTLAMHNAERKAVYYALRHAQVPVDFLSEDDVIDGSARNYSLIYVTEEYLHSRAVRTLAKWVTGGGTLVALCGGGFRDEFGRVNPDAAALYGAKAGALTTDPSLVSRYLLKENVPFLCKQDLPLYDPIDAASWGEGAAAISNVPVIVRKQALEPTDGRVIGRFRDGSPAVVARTQGRGRTVLFGFLPGQAYLKSGLPVRPADRGSSNGAFNHFLPTEMDAALRRRLTDDFLPPDFVRPVACSETLVESTCIDSAAQGKLGVPLINYTGRRIDRLTVMVGGLTKVGAVRSVERGALRPAFRDGSMTVELPLDTADMLLIDR